MLSCSGITSVYVRLAEIDFSNEYYRISRCRTDERLLRSIENFGVLEAPVLLRGEGKHLIVFGHNRLGALRRSGADGCNAVVLDALDPRAYVEYAILKLHRNEISALGRLRLMSILRDSLGCDEGFLKRFARLGAGAGEEAIAGGEMQERLSALPRPLASYCDARDINMKILMHVLSLDAEALSLLSDWVEACAMRVNVFREIVELLDDIRRREGALSSARAAAPHGARDAREFEERLREALHAIRYPRYTRLRAAAEGLIREMGRKGAQAGLPAFFEGDEVELRLVFRKDEDPREAERRLRGITAEELKKLFELL